jgi:hypothetical protein
MLEDQNGNKTLTVQNYLTGAFWQFAPCKLEFRSSGMWRCFNGQYDTDVSNDLLSPCSRVEMFTENRWWKNSRREQRHLARERKTVRSVGRIRSFRAKRQGYLIFFNVRKTADGTRNTVFCPSELPHAQTVSWMQPRWLKLKAGTIIVLVRHLNQKIRDCAVEFNVGNAWKFVRGSDCNRRLRKS